MQIHSALSIGLVHYCLTFVWNSFLVAVVPPPISGAPYRCFASIKWSRDPPPRRALAEGLPKLNTLGPLLTACSLSSEGIIIFRVKEVDRNTSYFISKKSSEVCCRPSCCRYGVLALFIQVFIEWTSDNYFYLLSDTFREVILGLCWFPIQCFACLCPTTWIIAKPGSICNALWHKIHQLFW